MVLEDLVVWALFSATAVAKTPWACKDTSAKRLPLHWLFVSSQRVVRGRGIFPAKYVVQADICMYTEGHHVSFLCQAYKSGKSTNDATAVLG